MKSALRCAAVACMGLLTFANGAFAHHGNAAYADKAIELKQATVTKFLWSNPHSLIYFDVKDDKGKVAHWVGETGSPSAMILIGWEKTSVQPGDVITVYIYPSKEGNPAGRLNRLVLADGSVLHDTQLGGDDGGKTRYNPASGSKDDQKSNY
jgi:Family of unknown function (DUF6152)